MNQSKLGTKCIDELIDYSFVIPSYQRGYRWSAVEVKALLDDLNQFHQRHESACSEERDQLGDFYCLQPIVVMPDRSKKDDQGRRRLRLVDGQQRLTTIHILMRYLEAKGNPVRGHFGLTYETRDPAYLSSLAAEDRWTTPDAFYMHQAHEAIDAWFNDQHPDTKSHITSILLDPLEEERNTRVIWYELGASKNPEHEINAFIRLNAGKIRLTNAELIRALFLKADNFTRDLRNLSQINLAQEWDRIEKRLQDNQFWYFLHGGPSKQATRIDHLFHVHLLAHHRSVLETFPETAAFRTFLGFQELEKAAEQNSRESRQVREARVSGQWTKIKQLTMRLEEWHQEPVLYHLLGFWIAFMGDLGNHNAEVIVDLLARRDNQKQKHGEFEEGIKADIFQRLFKGRGNLPPLHTLSRSDLQKIISQRLRDLEYSDNDSKRNATVIKPLLLLFNIATLLQNHTENVRFPFHLYREQNWDIEHIRSVDSRRPKRPEDQRLWLRTIVEYWTGIPVSKLKDKEEVDREQQATALEKLLGGEAKLLATRMATILGVKKLLLDTSARGDTKQEVHQETQEAVVHFVARAWDSVTRSGVKATSQRRVALAP